MHTLSLATLRRHHIDRKVSLVRVARDAARVPKVARLEVVKTFVVILVASIERVQLSSKLLSFIVHLFGHIKCVNIMLLISLALLLLLEHHVAVDTELSSNGAENDASATLTLRPRARSQVGIIIDEAQVRFTVAAQSEVAESTTRKHILALVEQTEALITHSTSTMTDELALDPQLFHAVVVQALLCRVHEQNNLAIEVHDASSFDGTTQSQHTLGHIVLQLT